MARNSQGRREILVGWKVAGNLVRRRALGGDSERVNGRRNAAGRAREVDFATGGVPRQVESHG